MAVITAQDKNGSPKPIAGFKSDSKYRLATLSLETSYSNKEVDGAITYFGFEMEDASWIIKKITTSGSDETVTWASGVNNTENTAVESYTDAWDNRAHAEMEYGFYSEVWA